MTLRPDVRKHESGLRTQAVTGPAVQMHHRHIVALPSCCPVSGNPREGSTLTVAYTSAGCCLEVYSLCQVVNRFVGGWRGTQRYPAERNMEGMIATIAQMVADALERPVVVRGNLLLDTGPLTLKCRAFPCGSI
jgi:7-cyano-7-deazaguanine reductase